ncbi:CoA transferase [Parahaliea maris]|uniref:CoA transferase n=1 Tax=Parahaliea maris TaxID=2716870 RepID=A0A5C9A0L1_9GAMM|nr:CoA transferase [Parahaliea maris]TXS92951.1 CoA transferase [Parahaliea maris]
MSTEPTGVLQGIRVLDLTRMLAGPFCTMLLADHGAEVIKIESPAGDPTRLAGPFASNGGAKALGGFFQSVNRNKKSVVLDLRQQEGVAILKKLVETADVVVENFRNGVMEEMGLSFDELKACNPTLVFASISGFGDARNGESPYANWPAFDPIAQAVGGLVSMTGPRSDMPTRVGSSLGDIVPGMYAAFGILAALHRAKQSGEAQHVDVAMADSILSICESLVYNYSYAGKSSSPAGNHHHLAAPAGLFKVKDGWVSIAAMQDAHWDILCQQLNMNDLHTDPRFSDALKRKEHLEALEEGMARYLLQLTKFEFMERLGGLLPVAPVQDAREIFNDPHFAARNMLIEVEEPGCKDNKVVAGTPVKFSETAFGGFKRAPLKGEHTQQVLSEVGFSESDIGHLVNDSTIVCYQ